MKHLGETKKNFGMEIKRDREVGKLFLTQKNYLEKVLKRFGMNDAKSVTTLLLLVIFGYLLLSRYGQLKWKIIWHGSLF